MIENKSSANNIRKRINFDEPITDMIERLNQNILTLKLNYRK